MRMQASKLVLSLMTVALLAAPFAEAGRVGKGRSSGMQRSISSAPASSSPAYRAPAPAARPAPAMPAGSGLPSQANARSGPGIGTAVAAGVAGAAAGYMLGQAMSDDPKPAATTPAQAQTATASTTAVPPTTTPTPTPAPAAAAAPAPAEAPSSGGLPWGGIALLLLLAGGAYMLMSRKKPATRSAYGEAMQRGASPFPQPAAAANQHGAGSSLFSSPAAGSFATPSVSHNEGRLPDGTEVPHFLRQAKATFMHVQSMNNPANIGEIAKYMTPALFAEIKADIASNQETADFPTLNCDFLEAVSENQGYVASVRFHGMVSESVNAPLTAFSEIWHYVKSAETDQKWLVAGIQQE